jgi:hypothetical protein
MALSKSNLQVLCDPHQDPNVILHRNRKINSKTHVKADRPQIVRAILSKKENAEGITILDFKLHYRALVTKKAWYCLKKNKPTELQPSDF